jgi:exodeoxyribonuclease III
MRLTTWNCRVGAFRRKAAHVAQLDPDVLVVQECEDVRRELLLDGDTQPSTRLWFDSPVTNRGVGVFSYTDATITAAPLIGAPIDYFVPLVARVQDVEFNLVGVWTAATSDSKTTYRQAHEGLDRYRDWIQTKDTVLMGDFNANASYGNGKVWRDLAERLASLGLVSAYHQFFGETFGKETRPTHFFKGKEASPFHLDYCFVPATWVPRIENVTVGTYERCSKYSDHAPLTLDVRA